MVNFFSEKVPLDFCAVVPPEFHKLRLEQSSSEKSAGFLNFLPLLSALVFPGIHNHKSCDLQLQRVSTEICCSLHPLPLQPPLQAMPPQAQHSHPSLPTSHPCLHLTLCSPRTGSKSVGQRCKPFSSQNAPRPSSRHSYQPAHAE